MPARPPAASATAAACCHRGPRSRPPPPTARRRAAARSRGRVAWPAAFELHLAQILSTMHHPPPHGASLSARRRLRRRPSFRAGEFLGRGELFFEYGCRGGTRRRVSKRTVDNVGRRRRRTRVGPTARVGTPRGCLTGPPEQAWRALAQTRNRNLPPTRRTILRGGRRLDTHQRRVQPSSRSAPQRPHQPSVCFQGCAPHVGPRGGRVSSWPPCVA